MKTLLQVFLMVTVSILTVAAEPSAEAESPEEGVIRVEEKWKAGEAAFSWDFWIVSGEVAEKHGIAVIDPVMERSKNWKGAEGLVYVPMLALLPREEAVAKLEEYQKVTNANVKLWAGEFLIEFEMSDTKEAVDKYKAEQGGGENPDEAEGNE